jgi:polyhydroxyalkanoate synthase
VPVDGPSPAAVIDQMWQANPLQKLLAVDWGAIMQALSTLSARSMADPVHAAAVAANLSLNLWKEAAETWIGAASFARKPSARFPIRPNGTASCSTSNS